MDYSYDDKHAAEATLRGDPLPRSVVRAHAVLKAVQDAS